MVWLACVTGGLRFWGQTADRQQRRLWFGKIVVLKLKKSVSAMHRNLSILKNIKNNEMNVITLLHRN